MSDRSKLATETYVTSLDTVRQWLVNFDGCIYGKVDELYEAYKIFVANDTNSKKVSKEKFKTQVCEHIKCKLVRTNPKEGKREWMFRSDLKN